MMLLLAGCAAHDPLGPDPYKERSPCGRGVMVCEYFGSQKFCSCGDSSEVMDQARRIFGQY